MPTLSTPSGVVTEYFESLRWLADSAGRAANDEQARRISSMATIIAVTAVEVFLNLWFRVLVDDRKDDFLKASLVRDLEKSIPLDQKLRLWPQRHFGTELDLLDGPGRAFVELKSVRNAIVHFQTSHDTIHASNIIIHGLADTPHYDALTAASAALALSVAEDLVQALMALAGFDQATISHAMGVWIAKAAATQPAETPSDRVAPWIAPHVMR